ncbi:MAG: hypothetical protein PF505_12255 [Vallitaleaceae bacterium]|jgi:hypothetical protein|nr:hypothetical protein [Vallitaleaceae bacterium]
MKKKKKSRVMKSFAKQVFRGKISTSASYVEIYLSIMILAGIVLLSFIEVKELIDISQDLLNGRETMGINEFLGIAFNLIIGVEFVKMLAKHTPDSTVEVLVFAIARQLIVSESGMINSLFGVIAIALLFVVRKYLSEIIHVSQQDEYIVNSGISIDEINEKLGMSLKREYGNTVAGIIYNIATKRGDHVEIGYSVILEDKEFQVHSMDAKLIKQVKIIEALKRDMVPETISE